MFNLKEAVSRDFLAFFFFIMDPSGSLINSLKWFFWKKMFTKRSTKNVTLHSVILCRVGLRAGSHCAESDSAQYHTAPSQEIEMSENPKLSNTVRSRTPRSVKLRRVKQFFWIFKNFYFHDF